MSRYHLFTKQSGEIQAQEYTVKIAGKHYGFVAVEPPRGESPPMYLVEIGPWGLYGGKGPSAVNGIGPFIPWVILLLLLTVCTWGIGRIVRSHRRRRAPPPA
jgi:hypothetical protein